MAGALAIGHRVWWRGSFGEDDPRLVRVTGLSVAEPGGSGKWGEPADSVSWGILDDPREPRRVVLDLANGHWCYGFQVRPAENPAGVL